MELRSSPRHFIVVSGLPASGKTTLAGALAAALGLPLLDKDDILESLYDGLGVGDLAWRQRLSRASDAVLAAMARGSAGAVLTSFWRHPSEAGEAGTPSGWIATLSSTVVEVHCDCPVDLALARFQARARHPGHNDAERPAEDLLRKFNDTARLGPLGIGRLVRVETAKACDPKAVVEAVRSALDPAPAGRGIPVAEGYDAWARTYDEVANRIRDEAMAKMRGWTAHFAGKTVLEIGCGTGLNTEHLAAHAARVTAIDVSEGMLAVAAKRVNSPRVELRRHDLTTGFPGEPATYDAVVETLVLEHIEDLAPVFREAFRVLRPGGVVLASELHPFQQAQGRQARFEADGGQVLIEAYGHTISDFANAAVDAGFRIVRLEEDADAAGEPRLFNLVAQKP